MGRPALNLLRVHVALSADALDRIDVLVGEKGRSKFVRQAVDKMLEAVEFTRKVDADLNKRLTK
jgi:metal-responsive CopG/Arc/MetJ family transcriptional regulator